MFVNTLMLSISSSIDSMGIGITYGLKNTRFSLLSRIVFFFVAFLSATLSVILGNIIKDIFSPEFTNSIGGILIIGIGFYTIFSSFRKQNDFDFDNSNDIDIKEALILSFSLTIDSLCIGIGSGMLKINSYLFPIFVATFHLAFLLVGDILGKKLANISRLPSNIWSIISGLLLIIIGICRFL